MPHSKFSILIVEDDSHISRVLNSHLEKAFPNARVDTAGSAARAKQICEKFTPTFIIWDGAPNERGTLEDYLNSIPDHLWERVIPISVDSQIASAARQKGSHSPVPKKEDAVNTWAEEVVETLTPLVSKKKKR
jgi:chemotaxis response regulator CheB